MKHLVSRVPSKLTNIMVAFDAGSRVEEQVGCNEGIAHMLEHCIFKGTDGRSWEDINKEIGFMGGEVNAFTSHDIVAYYITVPFENTNYAAEVLSDIVLNSIVPEEEFLKEKEVVKEEEISRLDGVDSFIWNNYSNLFFSNYISKPVIGTQDSISKFSRDEVYSFYEKYCSRNKAVVAISGSLSKRELKKILVSNFGKSGKANVRNYSGVTSDYLESRSVDITKPGIEHSYVWIGYPGLNVGSELVPASKIMNIILGSGMDSRLFTEVRERRGLAYSVGSGMSQWEYGALNLINASTRDENVDEMTEVVQSEIGRLKSDGITDEELQRAKNKMRAGFYAASESSYTASYKAIRGVIFDEPSLDTLSEQLNSVTRDDVYNAANIIFDDSRRLTMVCRGES
jgi:predicted Zn-dependent peptidase